MAAEDAKELNLDDLLSTHGSSAPTQNTNVVQDLSTSAPLLPIASEMISSAQEQVQPQVQHEPNTSQAIDPAVHHDQVPGVQPQPHRNTSNQHLRQQQTQAQQAPQQQIQLNNTAPSLQHSNLPGDGDNTPHPQQHAVEVLALEHIDLIQADTQFDRIPSRPRRLLNSVSKSLPVLLTVTVAYIYYVYTVRVCITYLILDQNQALQGGLYLAVFNILILLFFVSYYQSIFTRPGSPSNPPSLRNPPLSIPPTTTPYQSQSPGPTRSGSDDRISSHAVATPTTPILPSRAHQSSHISPMVTTPKYPSSAISPITPSLAASSEVEHNNNNKDDHVIVIPDNTSTRSHRLSIDFSASGLTGSILGHGSTRSRVHIEVDALQRPVATLSGCKRDGRSRWCEICKIVKPDRCHHCSECNMCVLRMDHHCPWVNGCVGFGNYKQFYLFILYGSLSAVWCVGSMIPLLVKALGSHGGQGPDWNPGKSTENAITNHSWSERDWSNGTWTTDESSMEVARTFDIQWMVITVIAFLLALLIVSFTMVHTGYILGNQTTIESLQNQRNMHIKVQYQKREQQQPQAPGREAVVGGSDGVAGLPPFMSDIQYNIVMVEQGERLWDRGSWLANWKSIMGPTWWLWFVPYWNSQGDGIHDIYSAKVYKRLLADALAQARMQAINFGGVVRDLAGEELTGPTSGSGSLSSPPNSPTSPTRLKISTFGSQSMVPVVPLTSSESAPVTSPIVRNGSTRKRIATSPAMLMPSIRLQYDGSEASGSRRDSEVQFRQGIASMDSQGGVGDASVDDGSMVAQGGGQRSASVVSTPRQNSLQSQSPRQPRTPKSRPQDSGNMGNSNNNSSRRRQRTMSGGTSGSYGFGGPIKEFGLGLGMDGIPVDSGTGLKLSSGLLGRSSHGHLRLERGGSGSSGGSRQPRANQ